MDHTDGVRAEGCETQARELVGVSIKHSVCWGALFQVREEGKKRPCQHVYQNSISDSISSCVIVVLTMRIFFGVQKMSVPDRSVFRPAMGTGGRAYVP